MVAPHLVHARPRRRHAGAAAAGTAAVATAVTDAVAMRRWPKVPGPPSVGAAWVPGGALSGLRCCPPASTLTGRMPAARKGCAGRGLRASSVMSDDEAKLGEAPVNLQKRRILVLVLSCLLGPMLCFCFIRLRSAMNGLVVGHGAIAEMTAYMATGAVLFGVLKSNLIGDSAEAFVVILCRLVQKLSGDRETWGTETLRKFGKPLAAACQGMLLFLTVNVLVNAIPNSCSWAVPHLLRFCDVNEDGLLEASEIEQVFYWWSGRALGCFVMLQLARLLSSFREPLHSEIPPDAKGALAWYFRGVQQTSLGLPCRFPLLRHVYSDRVRQQHKVRRRAGESEQGVSVAFWLGDMAFAAAIWLGSCFSCVRILGIPSSAVVTVFAPLGVGGLAFSLASKNIVQNVISGILMFLNRAFVEGDEIRSLDGKVHGLVSSVGLVNTEVLTLDGDPVVIPNTELVNSSIVNLQRKDFWLIDEAFPLYMSSFEQLGKVVKAMDKILKERVAAVALPDTAAKGLSVYEEPLCFFKGFSHQGATIRVRAYVDGSLPRHQFFELRSDILLELNDVAFAFQGTGIAFEGHMLGSGKGGE